MKQRLITVALPYVNNIPHLGTLLQVLSGDVFARFCRNKGYKTLYVCGTDEYGTATETKALQEGISPQELVNHFYTQHKSIYEWFNISFDKFGRTSTPQQSEIVQDIFTKLDKAGYITEHSGQQLYCTACSRFLADRYVNGTCPKCGYEKARGDQCDNCAVLLDPVDLISPTCAVCGCKPYLKETKHLYINLPALTPVLEKWLNKASKEGFWSHNATQTSKSWLRDGLRERAITRDLKWGVKVPKPGYEDKVFYVWFDAPIGYISITKALLGEDYKNWWLNPDKTHLYQFIGKDNIPFHTVIFPASLLGSGDKYTLLHHISATEYLNYENEKFSKTRGVGVFGDDCQSTGIPADVWRFYLCYTRPEKSDSQFMWLDFAERINSELIGNFGNFVNRVVQFVHKFYGGTIPQAERDVRLWEQIVTIEAKFMAQMEKVEIKEALRTLLQLSNLGNKHFQDNEPWRKVKENPNEAQNLIFNLSYLVRDIALLAEIFIPTTSATLLAMFNSSCHWAQLGATTGLSSLNRGEVLFKYLEPEVIENLRCRFAGKQEERETMHDEIKKNEQNEVAERIFSNTIDLRAATISAIERHSDAENLYILQLDVGTELGARQIVSSIVPFYSKEDLLGKTIVLVSNLKKAKFRGTLSEGMLMAAEHTGDEHPCEVVFTQATAGTRFLPQGMADEVAKRNISISLFENFPMQTTNGLVNYKGKVLTSVDGQHSLKTYKYLNDPMG